MYRRIWTLVAGRMLVYNLAHLQSAVVLHKKKHFCMAYNTRIGPPKIDLAGLIAKTCLHASYNHAVPALFMLLWSYASL